MESPGKYTAWSSDPASSHELVAGLVPRGARVLEFGCATGYMSRVLRERLGCTVTGVELFAEAAELARPHCRRVIVADAESPDLVRELEPDAPFDVVLFADVLEHLRDPAAVLQRVRPLLAEGGAVVSSIPNVAHGSVRLALLNGEFRYRPTGLLDDTHVRFFTRSTVQDLFEGAGYTIARWLRVRRAIDQTEVEVPPTRATLTARDLIMADPDATTYQFIVRAIPSEAGETLLHLRAELDAARREVESLTAERVRIAAAELAAVVPVGQQVIWVDQEELGPAGAAGRSTIPFTERDGQYWGPPADDAAAIAELLRLRAAGAAFIAFAWPARWWLDHYTGLHQYLRDHYSCVLESERLTVFDLRGAPHPLAVA
jgi:2-polyprenyl-3-methyl-5-hydroxy-6-metoxy-1,4-benzoquinol methylase